MLGLIATVAIGSTLLIVSRLADLRPERRIELAALARGDLPDQQPAAGRARRPSIFWGTFFPLIAEAVTGTRSSLGGALVRPLRDADRRRCWSSSPGSARCSPGAS